MHKIVSTGSLALALLISALDANSQQSTPQLYSTALFLKVPIAQESAFIEFYKTGAGAKVVQARMKADPDMTTWSLRKVAYPGVHAPEANFVIISGGIGAPKDPDPAKRDSLYRSASGLGYDDYMKKARSLSDLVGQTLTHVHDRTEGYNMEVGDYSVSTRLKIHDGKLNDLSAFMKEFRLPLAAERVKQGQMKGWSYSHLAFAGGSFDASETSFYKDLASAVQSGGGNSAASMTRFAKVFPDKDYVRYVNDRRELATVVKTEVYRVVIAVRK